MMINPEKEAKIFKAAATSRAVESFVTLLGDTTAFSDALAKFCSGRVKPPLIEALSMATEELNTVRANFDKRLLSIVEESNGNQKPTSH